MGLEQRSILDRSTDGHEMNKRWRTTNGDVHV